MKSPILVFYLDSFKSAAAEGAVLELKLRLLAGKVPAMRKYAHQQNLGNIEDELATHFGDALSVGEKDMLRLCRQLRNKVLHSDFHEARRKLGKLGIDTQSGGVKMISLPVATVEEVSKKIGAARDGTEGTNIADTLCTGEGSVYGWLFEAGAAGDFDKACDTFKKAGAIVDRLSEVYSGPTVNHSRMLESRDRSNIVSFHFVSPSYIILRY